MMTEHAQRRRTCVGWFVLGFLGLALALAPAFSVSAAETLNWNTNQNRVSADLRATKLLSLLEQIATATGWRVYVEPDTLHTVSAKFQNLPPGEALRLLLGDVNFALLPGTNAGCKLFVFRTSRDNATQLVSPVKAGKARVIPNELIVRLKPGANIEELARLLGAKVVGRIDSLNAYRLQFDDAQAADNARAQLADNPSVASVENNYVVDRPPNPLTGAGDVPPLSLTLKPPPDSGRITIGLVDTGVQSLGDNLNQFILKQLSVAGQDQFDPTVPSHGTAMAATILRTLQALGNGSSSVLILPVDIYGPNETTSTFDVALGIALAVNNGANPVNLSLGSPEDSPVVRDLIAQGSQQGIVFYTAKGNTPDTTLMYPAGDPGATPVTAVEPGGQVAPYANRAPLSAVGARGTVLVPFGSQTFVVQGTSPATAITSGSAAFMMESGSISAAQANAQILKNPTPTTLPNR